MAGFSEEDASARCRERRPFENPFSLETINEREPVHLSKSFFRDDGPLCRRGSAI